MATANYVHSNFYLLTNLYIFSKKSPNLVELSFSLSELWAKDLKGSAEQPPSPGQDRVKSSWPVFFRKKSSLLPDMYIVNKDVQTFWFMFNYQCKKVRECLLPVQPCFVRASNIRNSIEASWAKKRVPYEEQGIYNSSRFNCNRTY